MSVGHVYLAIPSKYGLEHEQRGEDMRCRHRPKHLFRWKLDKPDICRKCGKKIEAKHPWLVFIAILFYSGAAGYFIAWEFPTLRQIMSPLFAGLILLIPSTIGFCLLASLCYYFFPFVEVQEPYRIKIKPDDP